MRIIIISLLSLYSLSIHCMQQSNSSQSSPTEDLIEFKGVKKPLLGHVVQALLEGESDPFSVTRVFRYKDSKFQSVGDILDLEEDDINEYIEKKNYVYTSFYNIERTRNGTMQPVGSLLLGSTDKALADKLHFIAQARRIVKKEI